jgi:hypothetical protein
MDSQERKDWEALVKEEEAKRPQGKSRPLTGSSFIMAIIGSGQ